MADDQLDALERKINEIEALDIIYNDETEDRPTGFKVLSTDELQQAQSLVADPPLSAGIALNIPTLRVEINLSIIDNSASKDEIHRAKVQFTLSPEYPCVSAAIVSVVSIGNLNRTQRDELTKVLNSKAAELVGREALMELIQEAQETAADFISRNASLTGQEERSKHDDDGDHEVESKSRRWIWVHHIKNSNRCKDIVREANEISLSGYLKSGYPGIVVVEGDNSSCDEFVQWIKGNKSRPGGFGRNWGHHVRGEVMVQDDGAFTNSFEDVGDDLAGFASKCREVGLEDEFKLYVMQH